MQKFTEKGSEQVEVSDAYFISNAPKTLAGILEKANSILPESRVKKELTEADKRFLDTLIDPKYPSLAEHTVKGLASFDPEIAELLRLDERYKRYLPQDEEE